MSEDPLALYSIASTMPSSDPSVLPSESDYEAICAAVMETLRGRWFLAEYARRNRHSDTKVVLSAIERIEMMIRGDTVATPAERFRTELADMAKAIARTKSEIAAIKPEAEQPGKILEASEELDSIVHATEKATSKILAAAEQVQEIAWTVREQDLAAPICDQLDALATDIYTACSFQDLTGQRIQKVIHAMRYLEERIDTMIEIWDEGVSAQNAEAAKSTAAPANAAAQPAPNAAHHDVALDDLDQTDVDMVMDPAQQEAAVKAETANVQIVIDHAPLPAAEPLQAEESEEPLQTAAFVSDPIPETVPEPQSFAPEDAAPESAFPESMAPESMAPHAIVSEDFASEHIATDDIAIDDIATESAASDISVAALTAAEHLPSDHAVVADAPEEVPVFFRPMEPGPIAEVPPAEAMQAEVLSLEVLSVEVVQAETAEIDIVAAPFTEAIAPPAIADFDAAPLETTHLETPHLETAHLETARAEPAAEPVADGERPTDLGTTIAAVRDALFAPTALLPAQSLQGDAADEPAPVGDDEPAADLYEPTPLPAVPVQAIAATPEPDVAPVAEHTDDHAEQDVAPTTTATLVGPAEFLLEPLSPPALRALEAVGPFAEREPDTAEPDEVMETVDLDTVGIAPVMTAVVAPEPVAAEARSETAELKIIEPETIEPATSEREAAVIEAVSPEPAEAAEVEAPALVAIEPKADELEIIEIAEIEAVATAPIAPEPLAETAEETSIEAEADEPAKAEEPETVDSEPEAQEAATEEAKEDAEEEQRPAARTMMPEVTFASTPPVMMPMETARTEPAEQRFAAAATATPTTVAPAQAEFIPFGHVESEKPAAPAGMTAPAMPPVPDVPVAPAMQAASARPMTVAAPSIYSTSPYLETQRPGPAHVTQSDPLAAITALTDDEKIALFS